MHKGDVLTLTIERPAAGGRMIARHEGAIVFVAGAIPGETLRAEVEKVHRGTVWAAAREVLEPSPDRLTGVPDGACGGCVFNHIAYDRQRAIKAAIIEDAFRRIGRLPLAAPAAVEPSPIDGYRMRARLHVRDGQAGFFREGTHELCGAGSTRQLRPDTMDAMSRLAQALGALPRDTVSDIELSENVDGTARACHLDLVPDADPSRLGTVTAIPGLTGVTCAPLDHPRTMELWGAAEVMDRLTVAGKGFTLARHPRSFFQGNRYLLAPLLDHVMALVEQGPVIDLYAGVGLFSVAAAMLGRGPVVAVEGDRFAAADLRRNAAQCGDALVYRAEAVEAFVSRGSGPAPATVILDPPRTGLSKEALAGTVALGAGRVVYVSCDIATLARDARVLVDAGYRMTSVRAFDLFPNTAHVETVIAFSR